MSSTQNPLSNKLLLYFLIILGIIAIVVWTVFLVEQQKITSQLSQTKHEDEARDIQSKTLLREIKLMFDNFLEDREKQIVRQNNTTEKMIKDIKDAQHQNSLILQKLDNKSTFR